MVPIRRVLAIRAVVIVANFVVLSGGLAAAEVLPVVTPEQVGLSPDRLQRIGKVLSQEIAAERMPGAVVLIARHGKIGYFESFGMRDRSAGATMPKDAIFRIASMTKPFTSVAVMMLAEEGRIQLTEAASKYLPPLGKLQVRVEKFDPATGKATFYTMPSNRDMTIQDLLRHTSGLTYGGKLKDLYDKAGITSEDYTNAELVERLGKLPLAYQPGTSWEYSRATDVLGRLVEVVSGTTLAGVFHERIFVPLAMPDSGFYVPAEKRERIARPLPNDAITGQPVMWHDVTVPPKFESGGGGGLSTAIDYARFLQMLLNRGQLDGVRLIGRKTVEQMTSDQLGPLAADFPGPGYTFGLGFAVRKDDGLSGLSGSAGDYYWAGIHGTYFWVDPKEDMFVILMAQTPGPIRTHFRGLMRELVYQALSD